MRLLITAVIVVLGMGCVRRDQGVVKTQVVSFPDGVIVEYDSI